MDTIPTAVPSAPVEAGTYDKTSEVTTPRAYIKLYDLFPIDRSEKNNEMLERIWSFAASQTDESTADAIYWKVIQLKNKLGSSPSEPSYSKLYTYVQVHNRFKEAERELKSMEL